MIDLRNTEKLMILTIILSWLLLVAIVRYHELYNHAFQSSWDAMVWYFYDQFSSRACLLPGGPGPRFRPRKSRTDGPDARPAPVTGLRSLVSVSRDWTYRGFRDRDGRVAPCSTAAKAAPARARVKQSDWSLAAAGRASNWSLASVTWAQWLGGSEQWEWSDTGDGGWDVSSGWSVIRSRGDRKLAWLLTDIHRVYYNYKQRQSDITVCSSCDWCDDIKQGSLFLCNWRTDILN